MQRKDDNADVLKKRLSAYHTQTSPILDYYKKQNLLYSVNAMQKMGEVKADIHKNLFENKF